MRADLLQGPISKYSHVGGLGLQHMNCGGCNSAHKRALILLIGGQVRFILALVVGRVFHMLWTRSWTQKSQNHVLEWHVGFKSSRNIRFVKVEIQKLG